METLKKVIVFVLSHIIAFFKRGKIFIKAFFKVMKKRLSQYPKKLVYSYLFGIPACIILLIFIIKSAFTYFAKPDLSNDENICPYDFELLKESDSHIYAWLEVPGTEVNYPVHMSKHASKDLEFINSRGNDLSYPNTFIYGQNPENDKDYFSSLMRFKDIAFCAENRLFILYTPKACYVYEIVAVCEYPDTNITDYFEFNTFEGNKVFLNVIESKRGSENALLFEEQIYSPDTPYVTLITSSQGHTGYNFLVVGMLIDTMEY